MVPQPSGLSEVKSILLGYAPLDAPPTAQLLGKSHLSRMWKKVFFLLIITECWDWIFRTEEVWETIPSCFSDEKLTPIRLQGLAPGHRGNSRPGTRTQTPDSCMRTGMFKPSWPWTATGNALPAVTQSYAHPGNWSTISNMGSYPYCVWYALTQSVLLYFTFFFF